MIIRNFLRCGFIVTLIVISSHFAYTQTIYYELFASKKYQELDERITKAIVSSPENIVFNHVYAKLHAIDEYVKYDLQKSYTYYVNAIALYSNAQQSEKDRLKKLSITKKSLQNELDTVCSQIFRALKEPKTIEAYNTYINGCSKCSNTITAKAITERNALAFAEAKNKNTISALNNFISSYPQALEVALATKMRDEKAYNDAISKGTSEAYSNFLKLYPQSSFSPNISKILWTQRFKEETKDDDFKSYEKFVVNNPQSPLAKVAIERMIQIAKEQKRHRWLFKTVTLSQGIHFEHALLEYYKYISQDGEYRTLFSFVQQFPRTFLDTALIKEFKIAEEGERLELEKPFDTTLTKMYESYIKMAAPREKAYLALQKVISIDLAKKNWPSAIAKVKRMAPYFGKTDMRILSLLEVLGRADDNTIQVSPLPGQLNTRNGGEYSPVISADNKYLYFCGSKRDDNLGLEDIFVSKYDEGSWQSANILMDLNTGDGNEAVLSLSTDGTKMLYFRESNIFYSEKTAQGWQEGVSVSREINNSEWAADAMITGDGKAIIFASVRIPDGMNLYTHLNSSLGLYHGNIHHQSDIYVSLKLPTGGWGRPINLGPAINTMYTDRSPYLHQDMKTLYFSSDGHGGLGNLDVYKSTRLSDTCWDCWSAPENLGKEINTSQDNWGYRIAPDGETFYFAAVPPRLSNNDIFMVKIPEKFLPEPVVCVKGKIKQKGPNPPKTIVYEDLTTGEIIGRASIDPVEGTYTITLPNGKMYGYYIEDTEYYPQSESIDLTKKNENKTITQDIAAVTITEMQNEKLPVRLNNLFFDTNKSDLLPYSIPELQRVAKILLKHKLRVEISGHTDAVGDNAMNVNLSMNRAEAVKKFLVSQGCPASMFEVKGYGKDKPVDTNETPEGRANNRRVELRFL